MGKLINFPITPEISQEFLNEADELQEQITEIRNLIGYNDPPSLKIIEGGLE